MILFKIILIFLSYVSCGVRTRVITEVWKRLGERESKRGKRGVTQREMTSLIYLGIWICWWTLFQSDSILLDTSLEIHPNTIFQTRPNMQSQSKTLVIHETFSHELAYCQLEAWMIFLENIKRDKYNFSLNNEQNLP